MKGKALMACVFTGLLALSAAPVAAKQGSGVGPGAARSGDTTRMQPRSIDRGAGQLQGGTGERLHAKTMDQDHLRDHDRLRDPDQLKTRQQIRDPETHQ